MTNFSWHDEDDLDENWEETAAQSTNWSPDTTQETEHTENGRSWPIRPLWITLTAVFIIAIGITYWLTNRRIQDINNQLTAEIRTSHDLFESSLAAGDFEIFISMLSGGDKNWAEGQISYFQEIETWSKITETYDSLSFKELTAPFDLRLTALETPATPSIELNPGLTQGEVRTQNTYLDIWGEEIGLETSQFYGLGQERWLAMAPPDEYFGIETQQTSQRGFILIDYRSQDKPFVDVLLPRISTLWDTLCHPDLQLQCPDDPAVLVSFDYTQDNRFFSHTDTIYLADIEHMIVQVKSPLIFGNPADEASRERLADTMIRQLAADFIWELGGMKSSLDSTGHDTLCDKEQPAEESDFSNCVNRYHDTLKTAVAFELGQLGIQPKTEISEDDMLRYFTHPFQLDDQAPLPQEKWAIPLIITYLYEKKELSIGAIGHYLSTPELGLASLVSFANGSTADFARYLSDQIGSSTSQNLNQNIATICLDPEQENSFSFLYDSSANNWQQVTTDPGWAALHILPDDTSQILSFNLIESLAPKYNVYTQPDQFPITIHETDNQADQWQPTNASYNRDGYFSFLSISRSRTNLFYHEVNQELCTPDFCPTTTYSEWPSWSPDHRHYLATQSNGTYVLYNTETQSAADLGFSFGPYTWFNESTYIYPELISVREGLAYYRRTINAAEGEQLFRWQDILDQIDPEKYDTTTWHTNGIEVIPHQNQILAIYAQQFTREQGHILFVEWQTGELKGVIDHHSIYGTARYSPDGHWLLWETHGQPSSLIDLTTFSLVHDFATPLSAPYSGRFYNTFDWSQDGRWLLQFNHGYLNLIDTRALATETPNGKLQEHTSPILYPIGLTTCNGGGFVMPN